MRLEPYTVEVNLLVPRLNRPRLGRMLDVGQPLVAAGLIATALLRRSLKRR